MRGREGGKKSVGEVIKLVIFSIDEQRFGLPLSDVGRVFRVAAITPLTRKIKSFVGLINVQGTIVPVVNMRYVFNLPEKGISLSDQLILVESTRRKITLLVDSVDDVIEFPEKEIIKAEKVITGLDYLKGIVKLNGSIIFIHDVEEFLLLNEEEIKEVVDTKSDNASDV